MGGGYWSFFGYIKSWPGLHFCEVFVWITTLDSADLSARAVLPHVQLSSRSVRLPMSAAAAAAARKMQASFKLLSLPGENDREEFLFPPEQQPKHYLMIVITMKK